jgi:hypothetical protein
VALIITFPAIVDYWIAPAELLNDADVQQQLDQIQMPTIELPSINP